MKNNKTLELDRLEVELYKYVLVLIKTLWKVYSDKRSVGNVEHLFGVY